MRKFESVQEYLESQKKSRPRTYAEIVSVVEKSGMACAQELRGLILRGDVRVVVLRFNNKECPFYTMRHDLKVDVVKTGGRY